MKVHIPIEELQNGYIRVMKHPTLDLYIYNYTHKCQFERHWNEYTLMCRGLILDGDSNIVSRPLKKFFNLGEPGHTEADLPDGPYYMTQKLDGSFIEVVKYKGHLVVATRGSFESDQAAHAMKILYDKHLDAIDGFKEGFTYVFEILYPENRIVVDYGDLDDLISLTVIENETGDEYPQMASELGFEVVKTYVGKYDVHTIKELNAENEEGWVACWPKYDYYRVKIKFEDYVNMHRIVTGLSELSIWRLLKSGGSINDIIDNVPDELFKWAKQVTTVLYNQYHDIYHEATLDFQKAKLNVEGNAIQVGVDPTRKDYAMEFKQYKHTSMMFALLDGKEIRDSIWDLIRPKANQIEEVSELPRWSK